VTSRIRGVDLLCLGIVAALALAAIVPILWAAVMG
jgi:hypothetical protein